MTTEAAPTGLTVDSYEDLVTTLENLLKAAFSPNVKLTPDSVFGMLINIFALMLAEQNEALEQLAGSLDPQSAAGAFLSRLVLLNGIQRAESEYSAVSLTCTANTVGATIPAGSLVSVPATGYQFATDAQLILAPSASDTVSATAVEVGAITATAGTLKQIDTPIYGWASVTNAAAATVGQQEESDETLRLRRQVVAERTGTCSTSAIYAAITDVTGVTEALVLENNTQFTNSDGVPPTTIWAIVNGGSDADVAEALYTHVGAGVGYYGTTTVVHVDSVTGNSHSIKFSRPSDVSIYITVNVTPDSTYPADGDTQIEDALIAYFDGFTISDDVIYSRLFTPINTVAGHEIDSLYIGLAAVPTGVVSLVMGNSQIAVTTATEIVVNS